MSVEYRESVVYERTVAILVGEQPAILSAVKGENGVTVTLELSETLGNVTLHIAAYDKDGALTSAAFARYRRKVLKTARSLCRSKRRTRKT